MPENKMTKKEREKVIASMRKVLSLPSGSPARWRAAYKHFLLQRPRAQFEAVNIVNRNNVVKLTLNKLGKTKRGSRYLMSAPSYLLGVLKVADPSYFMRADSDRLMSKEHLTKMKKAFPEFFLPEEI